MNSLAFYWASIEAYVLEHNPEASKKTINMLRTAFYAGAHASLDIISNAGDMNDSEFDKFFHSLLEELQTFQESN